MEVKKYRMARSWLTDPDSGNSAGQWKNFVKQRAGEWKARQGFQSGQLVQPGQPGVRQGFAPKSQKERKPETRRTVSFKPHEVTIYRKAVETRAKKRDLRVPDWDNYPGRGYPSDYTPGQTISKDVGRMIRAGRIEKVGMGSGASQAETLLSKVDQDKIKKRFGSKYQGEWNFLTKKNKTGTKWGLPKKGNEELYQQIVNYVKGQHGPNFAFDSFDSANYHLVQMHRAANLKVKPNKNYVPIYSTKGIIGYKDLTQKGKEYYHADYTGLDSKDKKALLINKHHPDAPELNKLINIVEGTKQEYDEVLDPLFKKHGHKTPNLNQLIDSLLETKGRYDISSSIEKHHQYGVGTQPGKIQLITRDQNQLAKRIEGKIKANLMTIEEAHPLLKKAGVQIVIDNQKIGAPDIAPEKQIADWKKWVRRKTLPKVFKDANIPCIKADGGQCKTPEDFKKGFNETVAKAANNDKAAIAKLSKFAKGMRAATSIGKWTGYGLLAEIGFMVPFAAGDYAAGKSWKRILANATDYGFGPIFGQSEQEEFEAALPEGSKAVERQKVIDVDEQLKGFETDFQYDPTVKRGPRIGMDPMKFAEAQTAAYNKLIDEYNLNRQSFMVQDTGDEPVFSESLYGRAEAEEKETRARIAAQEAQRIKERQESGFLAQSDWLQPYAGGGMTGIRRPDAVPPLSGPDPQGEGLSYLLNRVRKE